MLDLIKRFLQESVYASREASQPAPGHSGGCGLGERPVFPTELNARQRELLEQIEAVSPGASLAPLAAGAERWIKLQDGLDRKRNHFLKDFRHEHGFDRRTYSPEVEAQFKAGIGAINDENMRLLDEHAAAISSSMTTGAPAPHGPSRGS
jgi:hypothetical protein